MQRTIERWINILYRHFRSLDRMGIVWYIGILYIIVLLFTTFRFTVLNNDFYAKKAKDQQTMILKNPASRGTIYSSDESFHGAFAVSTNLGNLAIDPSQSGSRDKLMTFLTDIVFDEFCRNTSECLENMGTYLHDDFIARKEMTVTEMKEKIRVYLGARMDAPIESVEVAEALDEKAIEQIDAWQESSLYFVSNNLYLNPTKVQNKEELIARLSVILGKTREDLVPKFEIRKKRHLEIIHKMSVTTRDVITKRMNAEKIALNTKQLDKNESIYYFLKIEDNLVRYYPEENIGSQIIGFVDNEGRGKYGVEGYFDELLQSESPEQRVTKDSAGRPIGWYVSQELISLKNGANVTLTIDRNIQKHVSTLLAKAVNDFRANKGSVIVMNPKTGAVIAMVNYPDYNPNNFTDVYEMERVNMTKYPNPNADLFGVDLYVIDTQSGSFFANIDGKRLKFRTATDAEIGVYAIPKYMYKNKYGAWVYVNDVLTALYEPGSVFKAITTAIGLDTGEIDPEDTYYDKWHVELDYGGSKTVISNVASQCMGRHTYLHALDWSCNVWMVDIIQKIWPSLFDKYIREFWFWAKTNITLDGENYSQISPYEKWSRTQLFTMSFWQGISATMLQMASAYSVLANGWVYMQPYIVESVQYPDGKKVDTIPNPIRRVVKEDTAKRVTAMLVDGVENGFAKKWWVAGYTVAGKTGTSQIPMKGSYENIVLHTDLGHTITSYGGFAPANNPKFVLIVTLNRPRTSVYSETTSSALFAGVAKYLLEYYKVPKN